MKNDYNGAYILIVTIIRDSMYLFAAFELTVTITDSQLEINNEGADVYYVGVITSIGYLPDTYSGRAVTKIFKIPIGSYITYTLIILQEKKSFSREQRIRVDRGADKNLIFNSSISSPFSHKHTENDYKEIWIYLMYNNDSIPSADYFLKFEGNSRLSIDYTHILLHLHWSK